MDLDELRSAQPPKQNLPAQARTRIATRIETEMGATPAQARRQRRFPRRVGRAGIAVVAAVVVSGTAAAAFVAASSDTPDPAAVKRVEQALARPPELVQGIDWRQALNAERVTCAITDGAGYRVQTNTPASEFPLADPITTDIMITECTAGTDATRQGPSGGPAVVCAAAADEYPVVVSGAATCPAEQGLRAFTDDDLKRMNIQRRNEVTLLDVPSSTGCPTYDEAAAWADKTIAELALGLEPLGRGGSAAGCYRPVADWQQGVVLIVQLGPQTAETGSTTTTTQVKPGG